MLPFLLASLCFSSPFAGELPSEDWQAVRLDLVVTPLIEDRCIAIEGTLELEATTDGSRELLVAVNGRHDVLHFVALDGPGGTEAELNVHLEGQPSLRVARLVFDVPVTAGTRIEVDFVVEARGEAKQLQIDPDIVFASWVEAWYPFLPPLGRSLASTMGVPGSTRFHLPPDWDAVSNGMLILNERTEDERTVVYRTSEPHARSFAAGPYRAARHAVGQREIGVYLLPGTETDARKQAELLAAALAAQEERFGPYPYASYAIAELPEESGDFYASSEQGFLMAKSSAFGYAHGNLPLWGHEMAHGWWGNRVGTRGPGGILCSESLAQYGAVVAIETIEGSAAATEFLEFSREGYSPQQCARGYFELVRGGRDVPLSRLGSGGDHHTLSDAKGHWVFHMLRRRVGDERFFGGLRELIEAWSGRDLALSDVRAHFVALAPDAGLPAFFRQWLDREGAPILDVTWEALDAETVRVEIVQTQAGGPFDLWLDVDVVSGSRTTRHVVPLTDERLEIELSSPGSVTEVLLDPDHELLLWRPEYGERP